MTIKKFLLSEGTLCLPTEISIQTYEHLLIVSAGLSAGVKKGEDTWSAQISSHFYKGITLLKMGEKVKDKNE